MASVVAAALWEVALDEEDLGAFDPWALAPPDDLRERVHASWSGLDPSGRVGAECWAAVERKFATWAARRSDTARFLGGWAAHEETLRRYAYLPQVPARALRRWGAPMRFADLTPAVDPQRARWACAACRSCATASPWPTCCCWPAAGPTSSSSASSTVPPAPGAASSTDPQTPPDDNEV